MSEDLMNRLYAKRGNFVNTTGDVVAAPEDGFPIAAGPWPNPFPGAVQMRCKCCTRLVGISPKGLAMHRERPEERPIFCPRCFEELVALDQMLKGRPVN